MSAADDQQAAGWERRLREIVLRAGDWTADHGDVVAAMTEVDRLRAELTETRRLGDGLAAEAAVQLSENEWNGDDRDRLTRRVAAWRSARGDAPTDEHVSDHAVHGNAGPVDVSDRADDGNAPTQPPAVSLPVTLSSVDDLTVRRWAAAAVTALADALPQPGFEREHDQLITLATWLERGGANYWTSPALALVAAIEAARGENR